MPTIHLVSHTHWDREWYRPFQQFRLQLVQLLDRLLGLLAADPAFRFFMLDGQTIVLDDYLAVRPERQAEIRAHVQAGRLLVGPWHILPDEFLVSPEATVRNLLQGQRTAARFGSRMEVGYLPDPFGHIGQMPQLLRGFGLDTAALRRGLDAEPCELTWQSPDGSAVFLAYLRDGYDNAHPYPLAQPGDLAPFFAGVRQLRDSLLPHTATDHILLMHGTDHMEAQPLTSAALAQAGGQLDGATLVHSTLPAYIAAVRADLRQRGVALPTVVGELRSPQRHHLLPGVLSTRMWIKQRNHACETLLERWVEPFGAWAIGEPCAGFKPSQGLDLLHHAWRLLMECHPHDSICGCSVDQVHEEMRVRFDQVEQIGEALVQQSLAAITGAVQTSPPPPATDGGGDWSRAVVVFNPLGHPRTDAVRLPVEVPPGVEAVEIVDEAGRPLPGGAVELGERQVDDRVLDRAAVHFVAPGVPGHGYRTYWMRARPAGPARGQSSPVDGENRMANEFLVLAVASDGTLTVTDQRTGACFSGLNRFVDGGDCGDEYNYAPPAADALVTARPTASRTWSDAGGQHAQVELEMALPAGLSADRRQRSATTVLCTIRTTAHLFPGVPRVDITTEVDNPARDHRLRVHFPVPFAVSAADYDGHFEVVRRPAGVPPYDATWAEDPRPEVPQRAFCAVANGLVGLLLANRGLPEVAVLPAAGGSEIALTLLRCVGWLSRADFSTRRGHAGPPTATPGAQETGRHRFEYAVIPHTGDWTVAYRDAYAFDVPLRAVDVPPHAGKLPPAASLLDVRPAAFVLSAVKPAEDGAGIIVRGYNITAAPLRVTLTPLHRFTRATRARLDEEAVEALELAADGSVTLEARGHEIVTVRFA